MEKISVIIPTYNHLEDALKPCIESLIEKTSFDREDVKFEIIVVANGCTDGTKEYIENWKKMVVRSKPNSSRKEDVFKLIWFDEALGYTKAVNKGIEASTGEYVVLLNNDVVFLDYGRKDEWWEELLKPFKDEKVGLTGPHRLICPATQRWFMVFFLVMIRADLLKKLKVKDGEYLDEIFNPGGGEDIDFCIKLEDAGYKCVRIPHEMHPLDKRNVTEFHYPVYHKAEATVHSDVDWTQFGEENWEQIFSDHQKILKERYPIIEKDIEITATISTKNRYHSTLPLAMTAIAKQTYKPKKLIIYDDGDHLDLRKDPLYQNIFKLFEKNDIELWVEFAEGKGQVLNHQKALIKDVKTDWIWRLDDDNVPEDDVLEKLVKNITPEVGAVAGLVLDPKSDNNPNPMASNKIAHFRRMLNEQWFRFPDDKPKEVEHLYSTFIYRREAAKHGYCMELSKVGHGEETLFSHGIYRNGYKLIIDPKAITWHFHYPQGGIRSSEMKHEMWDADDKIIERHLREWQVEEQGMKIIVLDSGIGDHFAFKNIIEDVKEKYKDKELSLAVCYPEVFEDVTGIALMSIGQALGIYGGNLDRFSVYKWMADHNWKKSIVDAYKEMYL